jgi:uncharacterized surface anchored protein
MTHARTLEKSLALLLVVLTASLGLPAFAGSSAASLQGRILRASTGAPLQGAVVKLALRSDAKAFESAKTDEKGGYTIPSLPAGNYDVAVEADGGMYIVPAPMALQAGEQRSLSLSVMPKEATAEPTAPSGGGEAPKGGQGAAKPATTAAKTGGFLHSAWGGAVLVVGSAVVIGAVVNSADNDNPASASPSK